MQEQERELGPVLVLVQGQVLVQGREQVPVRGQGQGQV